MKLVYIALVRVPSEKAQSYQIMKMCQAFKQSGVDVSLLVSFRVQMPVMRTIKDIWRYYGIGNKFPVRVLPSIDLKWWNPKAKILAWLGKPIFWLHAASFAISSSLYCLFRKADVYYSRNGLPLFLLSLFKRNLYLETHDFPQTPFMRRLYRLLLPRVDGFVVLTNELKQRHVEGGVPEAKILVAPDGVDLEMFGNSMSKEDARKELGLSWGNKIIGYAGQLHTMGAEKGIDDLIRALKIIRGQREDVILCLVGGPEEMFTKYLEMAKKEGLTEQDIIFVGHVPPPEVPLYLNAFDVCAMPFPWTLHYAYYMSPLKLFEYMASKRPIIATDLPSVREVLNKENAVLVEPDNPEALAQGIVKALEDKEHAERIVDNAYRDVQQYTWLSRASRILSFIESRGRKVI